MDSRTSGKRCPDWSEISQGQYKMERNRPMQSQARNLPEQMFMQGI